jgi:hypothetical protein
VKGLSSHARWFLSGTPPHRNFNDIQFLAEIMGIHLGVEELLPGMKLSVPKGGGSKDLTGLENMSQYMEVRSIQWHERRHALAQSFLNHFVRQNTAEIDEIPYKELEICLDLPPAERAVRVDTRVDIPSGLVASNATRALTLLSSRRFTWNWKHISSL